MIIFLCCYLPTQAQAQENKQKQTKKQKHKKQQKQKKKNIRDHFDPYFTEDYIKIYNKNNCKISISLGDNAQMKTHTIEKYNTEEWDYDFDPIIKIQTQDYIVTYQLKRGESYMIIWNTRKRYWDLTKINKQY